METRPSKSAKKREHLALQELGEQLIGLPEKTLRKLITDETLLDAIIAAGQMKAHGALRRQRQLVGKLMKRVDPEPIREALDAMTSGDRHSKALFRQAEDWRDRIVADGDEALQSFAEVTGHTGPELRSLVEELRTARSEVAVRTLRRKIFRQIYSDLQTKVQNPAP